MEAQPLRRSWSGFRTLLSALELPSAAQDGQLMPFKHIASPEGRRHDEEGVGKRSGREQKAQKNWSSLGSLRPFRNWCSFASSFRFYHKSHNIWSFSWVTFSQPALKENFHHHLQRWKLSFKEKHKNINPRNINAKKKCNLETSFVKYLVAIFLHLSCGSGLISHFELSLLHRSFKIPLSPVAIKEKRDFANPSSEYDLQAEHDWIKGSIAQNELPWNVCAYLWCQLRNVLHRLN